MVDENQPTLFEITTLAKYSENGLRCKVCEVVQPIENFEQFKNSNRSTCNSCRKEQFQVIAKLRKENKYPDKNYECPICERKLEEVAELGQKMLQTWVLDHCHETKTFRGWLCGNCNSGIGKLKDSISNVKNAIKYLENHKEKNNDHETI